MKSQKMTDAAKLRAMSYKKDEKGRFSKAIKSNGSPQSPAFPADADVNYTSQFVAQPNPTNKIYYNPDEAFRENPENAYRMISDMAIWSALQERQLATTSLPWSIVPQHEDSLYESYAAALIEDLIRSHLPNIQDFFLNFLMAIWFGRQACYMDYEWCYEYGGKRLMIPVNWTPVHGDTLVFSSDDRIGYRVGPAYTDHNVTIGVEGRFVFVEPEERDAWIVHHYQKTAGDFRIFTSAASVYGVGLRSRLIYTWQLKMAALESATQYIQRFGSGWLIGYFDMHNAASQEAVFNAMIANQGSTYMLFPRSSAADGAAEGVEPVTPPGGFDSLLNMIDYYNKQMRLTICGEELTAESKATGLGSNLATVQENTFARFVKYDAFSLQETITQQLVRVLQDYNGFGGIPPLRFEFSFDLQSPKEKLENAKILHDMGVKISTKELLQAAGFKIPTDSDDITDGKSVETSRLPTKPSEKSF